MLRSNAKVDLLRRVPMFSACSKAQLTEIAMITDEIEFAPGEALIREGERGRQFFVLIDGGVKVTKNRRAVKLKGGSEFFGEIALVSNALTGATVTATSPVRALVVAGHQFQDLIEKSPGMLLKLLRSLVERLAPDGI